MCVPGCVAWLFVNYCECRVFCSIADTAKKKIEVLQVIFYPVERKRGWRAGGCAGIRRQLHQRYKQAMNAA